MTTTATTTLTRAQIHAYIHGLGDADLFDLAVQVNVWRTLLKGHGYDATRALLIVALSACGDEFRGRRMPCPWARVWLTVWKRVYAHESPSPDVVREHVAEWAAAVAG